MVTKSTLSLELELHPLQGFSWVFSVELLARLVPKMLES